MPLDLYLETHKGIVLACHDVFLEYGGVILLVIRENYPKKGSLWPIGGRIERGFNTERSLAKKVKSECNLNLSNCKLLGVARTQFVTDPFGHGKGTDTLNVIFFARAKGRLKLDDLHVCPTIVKKEVYTKEFRQRLHPYVRDFMDISIPLLSH